jgi:hypothetical protein
MPAPPACDDRCVVRLQYYIWGPTISVPTTGSSYVDVILHRLWMKDSLFEGRKYADFTVCRASDIPQSGAPYFSIHRNFRRVIHRALTRPRTTRFALLSGLPMFQNAYEACELTGAALEQLPHVSAHLARSGTATEQERGSRRERRHRLTADGSGERRAGDR